MQDCEKLGSFYLGRVRDLAAGTSRDELVLYDSRDLATHAVRVGMTGSGKTGLCISLLEEEGGGYLIEFPDFPGCISDGETPEEAIRNGRDALKDCLATMREFG